MATFGTCSLEGLSDLREELQRLGAQGSTLREAGQICLTRLYEEFTDSLALARLFATVPYGFLPEREKRFARQAAAARNVNAELTEDKIVVTLLASRGRQDEWNEPHRSRQHLAIPLLSASFIQTIPLVGRVLSGTLTEVPWLTKQQTLMSHEPMGRMSKLIYVEDARTARTSNGHQLLPAQDFVQSHGVRTALALSGGYLNGTSIALVLFTREVLSRDQVSKFTTLVHSLKAGTMKVVMDCKIL